MCVHLLIVFSRKNSSPRSSDDLDEAAEDDCFSRESSDDSMKLITPSGRTQSAEGDGEEEGEEESGEERSSITASTAVVEAF